MSNVQRFVKLQSQYYEVLIDDKGLRLEPVDSMKYLASSVEKTVLGNEVIGLAEDKDNVMQKVIDEARGELMKTLKTGIKQTVLGCLGFEKNSWGETGFKVDHCNGRMSTVTELISRELKEELLKVKLDVNFILTEEERSKLKEAIRKDYAERYMQEVKHQSWSLLSGMAKEDIKQVCDELIGSKKKEIAELVLNSLLKG